MSLRTVNSSRRWYEEAFREEFVYVSADAARYLVNCGVALVGVDYLGWRLSRRRRGDTPCATRGRHPRR
ncbi:MAG: cyclase family protein [Solirubrobacterales bacterium]|nr:cyclase family protein [Solirubrobacterales bacterium]